MRTGKYWIGMNEDMITYSTTQKQYPFSQGKTEGSEEDEAFRFASKEGVECIADIGVIASANGSKVDILYKTYRLDNLEDIIKKFVRQEIRNALNDEMPQLTVEEMYSVKASQVMKRVENKVKNKFEPYGLNISQVSLLGKIRFPKEINDAIIA